MGWRLAMWILVAVVASGCASTEYTNVRNPAAGRAELLQDVQDCDRGHMVPSNVRDDPYRYPVMVVDRDGAARCLAERGWRPVKP
jgi:hypothetical protein